LRIFAIESTVSPLVGEQHGCKIDNNTSRKFRLFYNPDSFAGDLTDFKAIFSGKENPQGYADT
jgi:hypothetical protein